MVEQFFTIVNILSIQLKWEFNHYKLVWILWRGWGGKFSPKLSWMNWSTKNVIFHLLKTYSQNGDSSIVMHIFLLLCNYSATIGYDSIGLMSCTCSYVSLLYDINLIFVYIVLGQWLWHSFQIIAKHNYEMFFGYIDPC